jgi:hypothetical protein
VNLLKGTHTYTAIITMRHQVALSSFVRYDRGDSNFPCTQSTMFAFIRTKESSFPATKLDESSNGICPKIFARTNWYRLHSFCVSWLKLKGSKTPAGDVPIRSVTLASDGSCLVAGNNKVTNSARLPCNDSVRMNFFSRASVMYGRSTKRVQDYPVFKLSPNFRRTTSI